MTVVQLKGFIELLRSTDKEIRKRLGIAEGGDF